MNSPCLRVSVVILLTLPAMADVGVVDPLYRLALPPYVFRFPRDHAAHPEYRTEWWYYTGHLRGGGREWGYELTFFQVGVDPRRRASRSAWAPHTLYMAHLALTDERGGRFRYTQRLSRPALGMAGARTDRYHVWLDDWSAASVPGGEAHRLRAGVPEFGLELDLSSQKPPAVHGLRGVSRKAAGRGRSTHYYSLTRLATRGTLRVAGERLPVEGLSWMDHEFGSGRLAPAQVGWDWFSLQLDDGRELMLYALRRRDGSTEPLSSGTLVRADGTTEHLRLADFRLRPTGTWKSPHTGAVYPSGWEVGLPRQGMSLTLSPTVADQELAGQGPAAVSYWEGSVRVRGTERGRPLSGRGYAELTGYAGAAPGV